MYNSGHIYIFFLFLMLKIILFFITYIPFFFKFIYKTCMASLLKFILIKNYYKADLNLSKNVILSICD